MILAASCTTKTVVWHTHDFGAFKLKTPPGWVEIGMQGIDSYVGGLTNGKDTLRFDYGWYGVDLEGEGDFACLYAEDTVNGLPATIMIPDTVGKGYISMYIPRVVDRNKFTMWGYNIHETELVLGIFKSVMFKNSDSSQNPKLTVSKFSSNQYKGGKGLFYSMCASCHALYKDLTGPALKDRIGLRSPEWVFSFLTDRRSVQGDTVNKALRSRYGSTCLEFSGLTREEVSLIIDYIRKEP